MANSFIAKQKDFGYCPRCGSINIDFVDSDNDSSKYICRDCGDDYLVLENETVRSRNNNTLGSFVRIYYSTMNGSAIAYEDHSLEDFNQNKEDIIKELLSYDEDPMDLDIQVFDKDGFYSHNIDYKKEE